MAGRKTHKGGGKPAPDTAQDASEQIRLDKWLFFARFFKTRSLASEVITKGRLRINGQRQSKPGHAIRPGDVLIFPMGKLIRMVRVLDTGARRGPATEAQTLYLDLDPPASTDPATASPLE